jgi:hypothetical protein
MRAVRVANGASNRKGIIIGFLRIIARILRKWFEFPEIMISFDVYKALKNETPDMLITVAFPHPVHWGAAFAKKYRKNLTDIFWAADCGDPYMKYPFRPRAFYFKYIEKFWCRRADYITVPIEEAKEGYYKEFRHKIRVIPQGFDFRNVELAPYIKNEIPHFAYSGTVYQKLREVGAFLDYLCTLNAPFKFIVYTNTKKYFIPYMGRLSAKMEVRSYIPREELLKELSKMDFLINIRNESSVQQPGKLIDYYLTKRPILEISQSFSEKDYFNEFLNHDFTHRLNEQIDISEYDISNVTDKFLNLFYSHNRE